jgi:hypothetical protein
MQTLPMTRSASTFNACFRHSSCILFPQLLLLALSANFLGAVNTSITVQVSSETAPPGGTAQFKIFVTPPALVSTANISMTFDPTIFGPILNVAAFSATGDQAGYASVNGQQLTASFSSSSASLGQLPDLPVFVVTVPVLATAKTAATSYIIVDPTESPGQDQRGNTYTVSVNLGTFTVGGTLSIQSVTPGGGLLPSATVVTVNGTGFDATTTVAIDGVNLGAMQWISAQQLNVTLAGATEMTAKHVHVANPAGASVEYFAAIPAPVGGSSSALLLLPQLPSPQYAAVTWTYPFETGYVMFYSCLQNPSAFPVTATYYFAATNGVFTSQTVVIPPYGLHVANNATLGGEFLGQISMTVSAPIRMAEVRAGFGEVGLDSISVYPPAQMTSLGSLGLQSFGPSYGWNWQIGTAAPQPFTMEVHTPFPFTFSGSPAWLKITSSAASATDTILTLTPVVSNLSAGTYTGTVTIQLQLPPRSCVIRAGHDLGAGDDECHDPTHARP